LVLFMNSIEGGFFICIETCSQILFYNHVKVSDDRKISQTEEKKNTMRAVDLCRSVDGCEMFGPLTRVSS